MLHHDMDIHQDTKLFDRNPDRITQKPFMSSDERMDPFPRLYDDNPRTKVMGR